MTYEERIITALTAYYAWKTTESMNDKDCTAYLIRLNRAYKNRFNTGTKVIFDKYSRLKIADKNRIAIRQWMNLHTH